MKNTRSNPNESAVIVQNFETRDHDDLFQNVFRTAVATQGLYCVRKSDWQSEKALASAMAGEHMQPGDEVIADMRDDCDLRMTFGRRGMIVQLFACAKFNRVIAFVAGREAESVEACNSELCALFEPLVEKVGPERPSASFAFWYLSEIGPERAEKQLNVPAWGEIRQNYASRTSTAIDSLIAGFKPGAGGRLMLWHGAPGTGKTFAIRALAWEWREWCQFEYVFDPENLFGPRAEYLARMVLDGNDSESDGDEVDSNPRWRMLVLEDTGELLSIDAKERAGQGLSRLLNAVDGLLGQGSRVLFLVTTNEELGALHPAVTRPGRCALQIEFDAIPPAEASSWLTAHQCSASAPKGAKTIAELYAMYKGRATAEHPPIGFISADR